MSSSLDIGGNAASSFPFEQIGASVTGKILSLDEVQQTNISTSEPVFWPDGQPKMQYRLNLQTDLRDPGNPADDGKRAVYLRGSRKSDTRSSLAAVLDAVRGATGGTELAIGGTLTLTYVADGPRRQAGFNPPKQYQARYLPPSVNLDSPQPAYSASPSGAPYTPPASQQPASPDNGYSAEQLAALKAAGIDPATMQPIAQS